MGILELFEPGPPHVVTRSCHSSSSLCLFSAVAQQLEHCYQFIPLPAVSQGGLGPLWAQHILSLISTVSLGTQLVRSAPASAARAAELLTLSTLKQ